MVTYNVLLSQMVELTTTVQIEADSQDEARRKAWEFYQKNGGRVAWDDEDYQGEVKVVEVNEED